MRTADPANRRLATMCLVLCVPWACKPGSDAPGSSATPKEASPAAKRPWFRDITTSAGLDFVHDPGLAGQFHMPEIMGSGGALADFDSDGDLDLLLVQAGTLAPTITGGATRIYRNGQAGVFQDVTASTGLQPGGYGMGAVAGDYDNDGDVDVYLTQVGPNELWRNDGDWTFSRVSAAAGVDDPLWGTSATWIDYDRDGFLDLYVANYVGWAAEADKPCYGDTGVRDYCGPLSYAPQADVLYRNRGDGTFENVSSAAGIGGVAYNGLGVILLDANSDGWPDLYVANDQQVNLLWINQKDGTFTDQAIPLGCAVNGSGVAEASMGLTSADIDRNGHPDLFVTHLVWETHTFYRNQGAFFDDATDALGLSSWNLPQTGFGTRFLDVDHDGFLDLFVANGAVKLGRRPEDPARPFAERDSLLWQRGGGTFVKLDARAGDLLKPLEIGRGVLVGDIDGDGALDIVVCNNRGSARMFRNIHPQRGNWLLVKAICKQGRAAIGARVMIEYDGQKSSGTVRRQDSYLSSCDPRVHFGLGQRDRVDRLRVRWPSGQTTDHGSVTANRVVVIRQGAD